MKIKKIVVDERPKNCIECPINRTLTHGCGKLVKNKKNGALAIDKKPDDRCLLEIE